MYLSRLRLDPRSHEVRRDLADPAQLHRTLLRAFAPLPPGPPVEGGDGFRRHYGVLWRTEADPHTGATVVLVQSLARPDWSFLDARAGYLLAPAECKPVDEQLSALRPGQVLRFRLRANVTRKVDTKSGPGGERRNGRRVAWRGEAEQVAWLARKGAAGGFALLPLTGPAGDGESTLYAVRVTDEPDTRGRHAAGGLTFGSVLFEGRLRVTNPEDLGRTLEAGLGSAKAYGFGLLSLAPG